MLEIELLQRQLKREKIARKEAEKILESKSTDLYLVNQELKKLASNLADKEEKSRAILEASADGIIVLNKENKIELCNKAASEIFAAHPNDLIGKDIASLLTPLSREDITPFIALPKDNFFLEVNIMRPDNTEIPVELSISKAHVIEGSYTICGMRNILERKFTELYASAQHGITRILAESRSLHDASPKIIKTMCETLRLNYGAIWEVDKANSILICIDTWCTDENPIQVFTQVSKKIKLPEGIGLPGRTWLARRPYVIVDVVQDPNFPRAKWALQADLHSGFALPIFFEKEVTGVIEFYMRRFNQSDNLLITMLEDISNQIGIFIENEHIQKNLLEARRIAGMAEVSTGVLHNVGNVLNSVNVSINTLTESLTHSRLKNLKKIKEILQDKTSIIPQLLQTDQKGLDFSEYLEKLCDYWENENTHFIDEIGLITNYIQHINSVIKSQHYLSGSYGFTEPVQINNLLNEGIKLAGLAHQKEDVNVERNFEDLKPILVDKIKLFQILVNLISNAFESVAENKNKNKKISIYTITQGESLIIKVIDNGLGILPETLIKIFTYGFTTKKKGHGFGLHASAIAANEMGGHLKAESDGLEKGATFTLEIPYITIAPDNKET